MWLAGILFGTIQLHAQTIWSESSPRLGSRISHALAYDLAQNEVLAFGGAAGSSARTFREDTWTWDGQNWSRRCSTVSPSPRAVHAMASGVNGGVLLFGGAGSSVGPELGDSWLWLNGQWHQVAAPGPSARHAHAMALDRGRGRVVLFGGMAGSTGLNDTWEWDGSVWSSVQSTTLPAARGWHAMAYDSIRRKVVLFGGLATQGGGVLGDAWE